MVPRFFLMAGAEFLDEVCFGLRLLRTGDSVGPDTVCFFTLSRVRFGGIHLILT